MQGGGPAIGARLPDCSVRTLREEFDLSSWARGRWTVIFSHPTSYSAACTTELAALSAVWSAFTARDIGVLGVSRSRLSELGAYERLLQSALRIQLPFPVAADDSGELSRLLGMGEAADAWSSPIRKTLFIDPDLRIMATTEHPLHLARSAEDMLSMVARLASADVQDAFVPADWETTESGDRINAPEGAVRAMPRVAGGSGGAARSMMAGAGQRRASLRSV